MIPNYLYLISQDVNDNYDTYDSAVVVAESEGQARLIHPNKYGEKVWPKIWWNEEHSLFEQSWAMPDQVQAKLVGVASDELDVGTVVCSSFNAG